MKSKLFEHVSGNRFRLIKETIEPDTIQQIQSFIDNNQYLKGTKVSEKDLIESPSFILFVNDESLKHIKERHQDETKPGSTFLPNIDLRTVLTKILSVKPTEDTNGRVKWLGVDYGDQIGKFGVKQADPEKISKMQDYQMPDGKKEIVKIAPGERDATNEVTVVTSDLGKLQDSRRVLSLITMFPGGVKLGQNVMPMDRAEFAKLGFYFVVKGKLPTSTTQTPPAPAQNVATPPPAAGQVKEVFAQTFRKHKRLFFESGINKSNQIFYGYGDKKVIEGMKGLLESLKKYQLNSNEFWDGFGSLDMFDVDDLWKEFVHAENEPDKFNGPKNTLSTKLDDEADWVWELSDEAVQNALIPLLKAASDAHDNYTEQKSSDVAASDDPYDQDDISNLDYYHPGASTNNFIEYLLKIAKQ